MKKIGFFWHTLSSGNLGVNALSIANILLVKSSLLKNGISAEFVVFGPNTVREIIPIPELPEIRYVPLSLISLRGREFARLLRDINSCDVIFDIGAGDSFSDIYGKKRFFKMLLSKFLVFNSKEKLVLSPQTIGPFTNSIFRFLATYGMRRSRKVFVRDRLSFDYASSLTKKVDLGLSTDVAMSLPSRKNCCNNNECNDAINVGLNISGLLYAGGYEGGNQFGLSVDYRATIQELAMCLQGKPNVTLWLVSHVAAEGNLKAEDDYAAAEEVAKKVPGALLAPKFIDPIEAKTFIANLDFFIGSRMHATIAAFSSGVPVVPLAYSRKFSGLYESLGYLHVLDLRELNTNELISSVLQKFQQRDELRLMLRTSYENARNSLSVYSNYLTEVLTEGPEDATH